MEFNMIFNGKSRAFLGQCLSADASPCAFFISTSIPKYLNVLLNSLTVSINNRVQ